MDSSTPNEPAQPGTVTTNYPQIIFQPELHNMRHHKIHVLAYTHTKCAQTLLDIGCGDGSLIQRFLPVPDEVIPENCVIQRADGIDIDEAYFKAEAGLQERMTEIARNHLPLPLSVNFMKESFQALKGCGEGVWDLVLACEVVEHLDPKPLEDFPRLVLGEMKPEVFIVTTPDRRFNRIFDILSNYQPDDIVASERFRRPGLNYDMRHDDHRFEWTAEEFQSWAITQASLYGYTVLFDGVGGFSDDPFYSAYLSGMEHTEDRASFFSQLEREGIADACCTQIAVFKRANLAHEPPRDPKWTAPELPAKFRDYRVSGFTTEPPRFPPAPMTLYRELARADFSSFIDPIVLDVWLNVEDPNYPYPVYSGISTTWVVAMSYEELFERASQKFHWLCRNDVRVFQRIAKATWLTSPNPLATHRNNSPRPYLVTPCFDEQGITLSYLFWSTDVVPESPREPVWERDSGHWEDGPNADIVTVYSSDESEGLVGWEWEEQGWADDGEWGRVARTA